MHYSLSQNITKTVADLRNRRDVEIKTRLRRSGRLDLPETWTESNMPTDRQFEIDNGTTRQDYAPTSLYRAANPLLGSQSARDMPRFALVSQSTQSRFRTARKKNY